MKKVIFIGVLAVALILGCSKSSNNPVSSNEIWWSTPDTDARWIDISNCCGYRIPATQDKADSVCNEMGYFRSSGYEIENCYVTGEKHVVLSRVACSAD